MEEIFLSFIVAQTKPGHKPLLAISGGLDSIVLLHLAVRAKLTCGVAHVNFQLRGSESDGDELFVQSLAQQHNFPFYSTQVDTHAFAEAKGISTQMAARELRYQWFEKVMGEAHYDYLFTAHHLNDSLETSLLNFTRGTGISGMRGIQKQNQKTVRPLLPFTREEIAAYAAAHQLKWREDASNKTSDYTRNFIRHQVIPKLKELNPSFEHTFANNAKRFSAEKELIDFALAALGKQFITSEANQLKIKKDMLALFTNQTGVLWESIHAFGFNLDQCENIVSGLDGQSGKQFYTATHALLMDREDLIISAIPTKVDAISIHESDTLIITDNFTLAIHQTASLEVQADPRQASLDSDKISYPLVLRPWQKGDWFQPLGMNHTKKVSDFLIDLKLSVADKNQVWVLECNGTIAWVVGLRLDNRFKLTAETKSVTSFKINPRIV